MLSLATARILAVDIGTTATKAVVYDLAGRLVRVEQVATAGGSVVGGEGEQQADAVVDSVLAVLRAVLAAGPAGEELAAVVFSSQMYSILAVDGQNRPLGPSLTWADQRADSVVRDWRREQGLAGICAETGCPLHALYPIAKIGWMRRQAEYATAQRFVSIKEYVIFRLTGAWLVDWQTASASGLLDVRRRCWSARALELAGIGSGALSELVSVRQRLPGWTAEARVVGLGETVAGIIGGGDGPLASLGLGVLGPDAVAVNVGTSAAARVLLPEPSVDPAGRVWTYVVDDGCWVSGGMVTSGGALFDWARELVGGVDAQTACEEASRVAPGAEGLLLLPHLGGELSPGWKISATGSLHGLAYRHGRPHLLRAALEGICYSLREVLDAIRSIHPGALSEIHAAGGLSASPLWQRMAADIFGLPVNTYASPEASARGAAMVALLALGAKSSLEDFADWRTSPSVRQLPDPALRPFYTEQTRRYHALLQTHAAHD